MADKYRKILIIILLFNFTLFVYYFANSNINPSIDVFYYLAVADSFYDGTGLLDITTTPAQPIITPQNGIVFIHVLLKSIGLQGAASRLAAIKIIHYLGFLILIYIFYKIFTRLKISPELTFLSLGILLSSSHFLKTVIQPLNEGMWCVLTAMVFYLAISNENRESWVKIIAIAGLSIILANFRLTGPIIVFSICLTYLLLRNLKKALTFFIIGVISYASVYIILAMLNVDYSGFEGFVKNNYSIQYILNQPLMVLIYTIPGVFLGISGRKMMMALPFSIVIILFYLAYFRQAWRRKYFVQLLIISYIILSLLSALIMPGSPGGPSRFIIMIMPLTLLTITTYFDDSKKLRLGLGLFLLLTISVSMFRLMVWDRIYFVNNRSYARMKSQISEPYMLISEAPRYSYYIFGKGSKKVQDINQDTKHMILFGKEQWLKEITKMVHDYIKHAQIEYLHEKYITGHNPGDIYCAVKINAQ